MISFIVIGKNEGWKLTNCLKSIHEAVKVCNIIKYEIIYVDSKSTDDSIERAKQFNLVKTFLVKGDCNAAIARNIGAKEALGDILFFVDGDMEIHKEFLNYVYSDDTGLIYPFVSGVWINYYYDNNWQLIKEQVYSSEKYSNKYEFTTGGLFIIEKSLWESNGGMKNKMTFNEDVDLGLRLAKKKVLLLRIKELCSIHHTIPYNNNKRMYNFIVSKSAFFMALTFRDNIRNKYAWKLFIRSNYTLLIFIFSLIISVLLSCYWILILYFISLLFRVLLKGERNLRTIILMFFFRLLNELVYPFAFLTFWPKKCDNNYIQV